MYSVRVILSGPLKSASLLPLSPLFLCLNLTNVKLNVMGGIIRVFSKGSSCYVVSLSASKVAHTSTS